MASRNYNLRASPLRRGGAATTTTASSTTAASTSYSSTTSTSHTSSTNAEDRTLTPAPVQRTLYMEEDEDEEDDEVVEMLPGHDDDDGVEEVEEMGRFGLGARLDEETEEDEEEDERGTARRRAGGARREGAFSELRRRVASTGVVAKLNRSRYVQQATTWTRQLWQSVLRNSFMTANFLWLLVPLGCFMIAIFVPHYLTTAIRYVDILTSSGSPHGGGFHANLAYEKGMMRSIVQEIVDVKLSSMQDEMNALRNTIVSQEREVEGLRLLHESLRHVHDETQKKMSVVDSNSILSIHIEHVVSKHAENLWKRVLDKSSQTDERLRATASQQTELMDAVAHQQAELRELRAAGASSSPPTTTQRQPNAAVLQKAAEREMRDELAKWKRALQEELQLTLEREVIDIEDRMHKSLLSEKQLLVDSVTALHTVNAANPALVSMIESAVVRVGKKSIGAPDHAALANGATVVRWESDLLTTKSRSPLEQLLGCLGASSSSMESKFTSASYRASPLLALTNLLVPQDIPWWLSRHNGRPETALSETKEIGSCWGVSGSTGRLTVKFAKRIFADSVTIDHIPEEIATDFSSAPHKFRIFGVTVDRARGAVELLPFGNFSYARDGEAEPAMASQTFRLHSSLSQRVAIDGATLEIVSNHGHPDYTCLYRFQVHGTPAP